MSIWSSMDAVPTLDGGELDVAVSQMHPDAYVAVRLCMLSQPGDPCVELDQDQAKRLRDILTEQLARFEVR